MGKPPDRGLSAATGMSERRRTCVRKVSVIGAGNVGATAAVLLAMRNIADVTVVDVVPDMPQGKMLDAVAAAPLMRFDVAVTGSNDTAAIEGSDVVVNTAGLPRKPGMSRDDLLAKNADIARGIASGVSKYAADSVVINVANPLDAICEVLYRETGFPRERVLGMAGVLDSARFRTFLAWEIGCSPVDVEAMVLGGHGDSMVPLVSSATVGGVPVTQLLGKEALDSIVERTRKAGAEVLGLLKTGSAFVSPAASVVEMVDAVLLDRDRLLPVSVRLAGEYGFDGLFLGVPAVLGAGGLKKVVEVGLSGDERAALSRSADSVRDLVSKLGPPHKSKA